MNNKDIKTLNELKKKILESIPKDDIAFEKFILLAEIRFDKDVRSATIAGVDRHVLLLNKNFLDKYCNDIHHLIFVIYHEIYHIIFSHFWIKIDEDEFIKNIVFDAIINAYLTKKFNDKKYYSILENLYSTDNLPECILRPPSGYKDEVILSKKLTDDINWLIEKLYLSYEGPSYMEIIDVLKRHIVEEVVPKVLLLGEHPLKIEYKTNSKGVSSDKIISDKIMEEIKEIFEQGFSERDNDSKDINARNEKKENEDKFYSHIQNYEEIIINFEKHEKQAIKTIQQAIRNLLVYDTKGHPFLSIGDSIVESKNVYPDFYKRSVFIKESLGLDIIYYDSDKHIYLLAELNQKANVYVDVSDSMEEYYETLYAALSPFVKTKKIKVYIWSTDVKEIKVKDFLKGKIFTFQGTDISCVLKHILENKIYKSLIITDGIFSKPKNTLLNSLSGKYTIYTILTPDGEDKIIKSFSRKIFYLP